MKAFILSALLLASSIASADALHDPKFNEALPANRPPGGFVPVVLFYLGNHFVEVKQIADPEDSMVKCMAKASDIVGKLLSSEDKPEGASAIGACLPVPAAPGSAPAGDKPIKPYHDNKAPAALGGINTEVI